MIIILGAGGMLGSAVSRAMSRKHIDHVPYAHDKLELLNPEQTIERLMSASVIVNCAGLRQGSRSQLASANVFAPILAAQAAPQASFIHVSSDCVASRYPTYDEYRTPRPAPIWPRILRERPPDDYGRLKAVAERYLYGRAVIVRTSFVGEQHGLLRWFLDLPTNANVVGYRRAYWSGSHVDAVAERLADMANDPPDTGIVHLATEDPISKLEALYAMREAYGRSDVLIRPGGPEIDRSLRPTGQPLPSLRQWWRMYPPKIDTKQRRPGGISR